MTPSVAWKTTTRLVNLTQGSLQIPIFGARGCDFVTLGTPTLAVKVIGSPVPRKCDVDMGNGRKVPLSLVRAWVELPSLGPDELGVVEESVFRLLNDEQRGRCVWVERDASGRVHRLRGLSQGDLNHVG